MFAAMNLKEICNLLNFRKDYELPLTYFRFEVKFKNTFFTSYNKLAKLHFGEWKDIINNEPCHIWSSSYKESLEFEEEEEEAFQNTVM